MKLSEAIRLGSMMYPQAFGALSKPRRKYFFGLIGPKVQAVCALGGAYVAGNVPTKRVHSAQTMKIRPELASQSGTTPEYLDVFEPPKAWLTVLFQEVPCPDPSCSMAHAKLPVVRLIPHLNDQHRWSRERIAEFVEQLETLNKQTPGQFLRALDPKGESTLA